MSDSLASSKGVSFCQSHRAARFRREVRLPGGYVLVSTAQIDNDVVGLFEVPLCGTSSLTN